MQTVRAVDANRQFSGVLKQVSQGEEFLVISRGKPAAFPVPQKWSGEHGQGATPSLPLFGWIEKMPEALYKAQQGLWFHCHFQYGGQNDAVTHSDFLLNEDNWGGNRSDAGHRLGPIFPFPERISAL